MTPYKGTGYSIDSNEGIWNANLNNCTAKPGPPRRGSRKATSRYRPTDTQVDIRNEMVGTMMDMGMKIELHHHEVATAGQAEIGMRFDTLNEHGRQDHEVQVRGQERGRTATARPPPSCPSPYSATTAAACTCTRACGRAASPCSSTRTATACSAKTALYYIGGLLTHAHALLGVLRAEHQLLQETRARLRSTCEPRVLQQEQERCSAHTHVLGQPEDQAYRVQAA